MLTAVRLHYDMKKCINVSGFGGKIVVLKSEEGLHLPIISYRKIYPPTIIPVWTIQIN